MCTCWYGRCCYAHREPPPPPETVDQKIARYAKTLQAIYDNRTAGDYTFSGVLATFLNDVQK